MNDDDARLEELDKDAAEERYTYNHPKCPKCGLHMYPMSERYNLDFPIDDLWYECLECGYTVTRDS